MTSPLRCSAASTSPRSYGTDNSTVRSFARNASPIWVRSWARPSPVFAEHATASGNAAARRSASFGATSDLLKQYSSGTSLASISTSTVRTAVICPSGSAAEESTTWTRRSESATVFERRVERPHELVGELADKTDGVRAQHGLSSWKLELGVCVDPGSQELIADKDVGIGERVEQRRLAAVRVTDERDGAFRAAGQRARRCVERVGSSALSSPSSERMRRMILRRSTSSWVSPGPRAPMPPACWEGSSPCLEAAGGGTAKAPARPARVLLRSGRSGRRCRGSPLCGRLRCAPGSVRGSVAVRA